jgi:hypothetical protein
MCKKTVDCSTGTFVSTASTYILGKIKGEKNEAIVSRDGKIKIDIA